MSTRDQFRNSISAGGLSYRAPGDRGWQARHNTAVNDWVHGSASSDESVVLNHAYAIWTLLASSWGTDGYVHPNVTTPMMQAFHDLLNIDLGRLDGGTLSAWLCGLAERYEVEGVL